MTATVTAATTAFVAANGFGGLFSLAGAVTIVLLVALLVQKEIYRALGAPYTDRMRSLDIAIGPLLLVLGFASIVRFLSLL